MKGCDENKENEELQNILKNILRSKPMIIDTSQKELEALLLPVTLDSKQRKTIIASTKSTMDDIMKIVQNTSAKYETKTG